MKNIQRALILSLLTLFFTCSPFDSRTKHEQIIVKKGEVYCLATALYFEADVHETDVGLAAVSFVILNRFKDPEYPKSVCGVVTQGGPSPKWHCQFTFYCDGKPETTTDAKRWARMQAFAQAFLDDPPYDFTEGRKFYYAHKYFAQLGKTPPHWYDCKIFGSQTFCQSIRPPKRQLASN